MFGNWGLNCRSLWVFGFGQVSAKPNKPRPKFAGQSPLTLVESTRGPLESIGTKLAKANR